MRETPPCFFGGEGGITSRPSLASARRCLNCLGCNRPDIC